MGTKKVPNKIVGAKKFKTKMWVPKKFKFEILQQKNKLKCCRHAPLLIHQRLLEIMYSGRSNIILSENNSLGMPRRLFFFLFFLFNCTSLPMCVCEPPACLWPDTTSGGSVNKAKPYTRFHTRNCALNPAPTQGSYPRIIL